jgi:hypothetical protein
MMVRVGSLSDADALFAEVEGHDAARVRHWCKWYS